jgi:hypothetical protein
MHGESLHHFEATSIDRLPAPGRPATRPGVNFAFFSYQKVNGHSATVAHFNYLARDHEVVIKEIVSDR